MTGTPTPTIERVAEAICAHNEGADAWDYYPSSYKELYRGMAAAAIDAYIRAGA